MPNNQQKKGRGRGQPRGRVGRRGKCTPRISLQTDLENVSESTVDFAIAGPSTRTYEDEHALLKQAMLKTKKTMAKLSPSVKQEYIARKRQKEIQRSLLPDAPPRKRSRKDSPDRVDCRLSVGTPITPPPPKLQAWEIRKMEAKGMLTKPTPSPSPIPKSPVPDIKAPDTLTKSPTSTISFDSILEVSGFSPLHVDWTSGTLKTDVKMAARKTLPLTKVKPKLQDVCKTECSLSDSASCTSTSKRTSDLTMHTEISRKERVSGSDLGTTKANTLLNQWLLEEDNDSFLETEDLEPSEAINYTDMEPAHLPESLAPETVEWLAQEDAEADKLLHEMTPHDHLTFDWSSDHRSLLVQREKFTGTSGPTFTVDNNTRPLDVFLRFFDDDFFNLLVEQTNKYSTNVIDRHLTEHSRLNFWKNTDRNEMAVFFSILIFQGLAPLTVEKDYWRENGYLTLKYFKELMTYNRYVLLKRMLHFADNNDMGQDLTTDENRLRKIWPVLDHLNNKFSSLYLPGRDVAIDESLLKWHGRLSFAQKITTKAAKVGVKSYELCEASTGYLWKFFIYSGKGQNQDKDTDCELIDDIQTGNNLTENRQTEDERYTDERQTDRQASVTSKPPPPSNATARIVYELANPLLNRGHTIIMDNFYNSPLLARYLKSHGTDCYGTLRVNREFVPEAIKSVGKNELRVGELVQSYCRDLSVMIWRDTNLVAMLSTFHEGEVAGKEKYGRFKYKPQIVLDYNLSMGGVDKKDQLLSAHPIERSRNQAWYKKVFRRLLNVTILNSFIIFKSVNKNTSHRSFRIRLAEELVQVFKRTEIEFPVKVTTKCLMAGPGSLRRPILSGNHFIGEGQTKHARCVWCKKSRSKYICKQCHVALCLQICFEEFHTVE